MSRATARLARAIGAMLAASLLVGATSAAAAERVSTRLDHARAPLAQLEPTGRVEVPGGGLIHRYVQRAGGLPVFGAGAVVADSPDAPPVLVTDSTVAGISPRPSSSAIGRSSAVSAARGAVGTRGLRAPSEARLGYDAKTGALAWEVSLPSRDPLGDYVVVVDATSARVLSSQDVLWRATGSAMIFNPNPVVQQGNSYAGLKDRNDKDSSLLTSLRVPVSLERITSAKGCLVGTYADARQGKKAKPVCRSSLDFTDLTRSDNAFEAVMAYFHIDRTRAYIDGLGLSEALRSKPQRVRVNAIPDDNSYFSSMTRSMTIGEGGVDDGEDGDVIVHEYGHSLQDQAVHGFGRSTAAGTIGEGFGDYNAAMMSALTTGNDFESSVCIFDWDGISYSNTGCGRRADKGLDIKKAKRKCQFEIHCMGEVWSSALFKLRGELGNDVSGFAVMDRVVLESHFMYTPKINFRDAAKALVAADQLLYAGVHTGVIEAEMVARKLCPASGC
jgi:hypothetical protein